MRCPGCGETEDRVVDSRQGGDGAWIRRRRECAGCNLRFTTYERVELSLPPVKKRGGRLEAYDREKLARGLRSACQKRPVADSRVEEVISRIEFVLAAESQSHIRSRRIGDLAMEALREIDDVAFLRFASVYQSFESIREFLAVAARVQEDQE